MKEEYLCQDGDTGEYQIIIPLSLKDAEKATQKADAILNDLLSACSCARRVIKDAPMFKKDLAKIEKLLWRVLK